MEIKDTTTNQETPSLLFNPNNSITVVKEDGSPRKNLHGGVGVGVGVGVGGSGDRLKRDEWSEGAVSCLLEAYENKWILRNRAKLKGHDWEDVARHVSSRSNFTKSSKTQTQCKNKIESMKKRYRSESATSTDAATASSWPLYHRLDLLLRGNTAPPQPAAVPPQLSLDQSPQLLSPTPLLSTSCIPTVILMEASPSAPPQPFLPPPPAPPPLSGVAQNSHGSNGVDRIPPKEDGVLGITKPQSPDKNNDNILDTDSSTPALYSDKDQKLRSKQLKSKKMKTKKMKKKMKTTSSEELDHISGSIRWLAEVVVRSEQARMEMIRDIEKMRAEAEAKRGEMDLKRTEIIANTQLEIAKIFAAGSKGGVDSSLRIGRS